MIKKFAAVFLAALMAFSVFSILGSAVDLDPNTGLISVEEPATIDINISYVDSNGTAIPDLGSVAPGSTVKARVSVGTNYYTGGVILRFYYPTAFFSDNYTSVARYPGALNTANSSVGANKISDIGIVKKGTSGDDSMIDIATYVSDWEQSAFLLDGSTWLFEIELTVKADATGTAGLSAKASDFVFYDNPNGYNNIEYAEQSDKIADSIPLEWANSSDFTVTCNADEVTTGNSVTFNAAGGSFSNDEETLEVEGIVGKQYNIPADPSREHYTFLGWYEDAAYTTPAFAQGATQFEMPLEQGVVYYAKWNENVIIHFAETGENPVADQEVSGGIAWPAADKPNVTKDGYKFMGWEGEGVVDGVLPANYPEATAGNNEYTYTATWSKYVTITFDAHGGTFTDGNTGSYSGAAIYGGETWDTSAVPVYNVSGYTASGISRPGYALIGWNDGSGRITQFPAVYPDDDVTYTAIWQPYNIYIHYIVDPDAATAADVDITKATDTKFAAGRYGDSITLASYADQDGTVQNWVNVSQSPAATYSQGDAVTAVSPFIPLDNNNRPVDVYLVASAAEIRELGEYNANFDPNGGKWDGSDSTGILSVPYAPNENIADPGAVSRVGYTFEGWSPALGTMGAEDIDFTAVWTPNDYSVEFKNNYSADDTSVYESLSFSADNDVEFPADPEREGYVFAGWFTDAACTAGNEFESWADLPAASSSFSVYAKWEVIQYTLTVDLNGGSLAQDETDPSGEYDYAADFPAMPEVEKTGYSQAEPAWKYYSVIDGVETELASAPATMPAYDVKAVAQWTINQYTITFDSDGGTEVAAITQDYDTAVTAPADPTKEGYTFQGWSPAVPETMPAEDITVTAQWQVISYTLTVDLAEGSLADGATNPAGEYDYGVAFPAMPEVEKTGYSQAEPAWKYYSVIDDVETELSSAPATMPAYDVKAEAQWVINQYTITFDTDGGTEIAAITQDYDTPVTRPADPTKEGYTFAGWDKTIPTSMPAEDMTITAQWTVNQYTISFDTDGGTEIAAITQDYGTAVTAPANPTKTGYTFAGWDKEIPTTMPAENTTITALWNINQYTITFDTDGGTEIAAITQNYNTDVTAPADPTKEGYTFAGWQPSIPNKIPAENITVTAQWTINQYTITFNSKGGSAVGSITQDYNTAVAAPAEPTKTGYTFGGWYYDDETFANAAEFPMNMPAQNTELFAKWVINQYELTVVLDGGEFETGVESPAGEYDYNAAFPTMPEPVKEGYEFTGWAYTKTEGGDSVSRPENMPAYDITATAQWQINQYTITFNTDGGSYIAAITQDYNTAVTAPANPTKEGYTFAGWQPSIPETMPAEDITVTAQWTINQYTITFDTDGGSAVAPITQDYNTAVTAPADPTKEGYTFAGWSPAVPETMPAENITVTAQWTINQYTITFNTDGGTEIAAITQDYNTAVTAPADPEKTGYTFAGWDKTIPTAMPAENITVTALWTINQYTITFNTNGGTAIEPITQNYNTDVTAPADPTKEGYTFGGWYANEELTVPGSVPATMPAEDITLYAKWGINLIKIHFVDEDGTTPIREDVQGDYDTAVPAVPDPTREGYTFAGWNPALPETFPSEDMTVAAQWTINHHSITYIYDNGVDDNEVYDDITFGDDLEVPADPEKTGYTFVKWLDTDGKEPDDYTSMPDKDLVFTAQWTINQYTITFDSNGGSAVAPITQDYNTAVTAPAAPTKEGHTFSGWSPAVPETMPAENITVTAQWTVNQYTITFNTDGGTEIAAITQDYGTAVTAPANPTKTGYTFADWDTEIPATMPAENITITALWNINQYTITFDTDGGSDVAAITQNYDTAVTAPADPTKEGYTFAGWQPSIPDKMPAEDITVTAQWTINQYTITFDTDGGTEIAAITQDYNTAVTAPADPTKEGYTFSGWSPAVPGTMPAENITVTAQWTINQYTITFDTDGGTEIAAITQDYNTAVTAPADPTKEGYSFADWDKTIPTVMPAENITVTAQWTVNQYTIKLRYLDDNNEEVVIDTITQDYGTAVATPDDPTREGYTFDSWSREIPATMPAENLVINAQWTVNQYTITFDTDGGTAVAPITQDYGTAVTAPADPTREGYTFGGWDKEIPNKMPAEDLTITAQWTINQYTITFDTDGGTEIAAITQDYDTAVTAPADPTKEGYTFGGWDKEIPNKMPAENITITAQWTINQYSITFNSNGGSAVDTISKDYGEAITAPDDPTKTGYTFGGWFTDNETFENAYTIPETMPAESAEVYAKWTVNQYTVTFNTNGGSAVAPVTQDYDTLIDPVPESEKTGFEFQGWYLDNETFTQVFNNKIPADNITVFAKWGINSVTISFNSNGGSEVQSISGDYNTTANEPVAPTKAGYDFDGWYEDPEFSGNSFFRDGTAKFPAESITLNAKWTEHVYTVKFLESDSFNDPVPTFSEPHDDHIFENNIQEVAFGAKATVPSGNPEINYYEFIGWATEPNGTPVDFDEWTMPAAETDSFYFYPVFERVPVTLQIALESGSQADIIKVEDQAVTGYIYNAGNRLTVAKLTEQLTVVGNGTLKITASKAPVICGTGTRVELIDNLTDEVVETYYLIVAGDVSGDAVCTAKDVSFADIELEKNLNNWSIKDTVSDAEARRVCAALAADVNGDGAFDGDDAGLMELFVLDGAAYTYNTETHKYNVSVG